MDSDDLQLFASLLNILWSVRISFWVQICRFNPSTAFVKSRIEFLQDRLLIY